MVLSYREIDYIDLRKTLLSLRDRDLGPVYPGEPPMDAFYRAAGVCHASTGADVNILENSVQFIP